MEKIRVRGWHVSQEKMFSAEELAKDQLTLLTTGQFIKVHGGKQALSVIYPENEFIPLQYTGWLDPDRVEVYIGDIQRVICSCGYTVNMEVVFERGKFQLKRIWEHDFDIDLTRLSRYKVIGNIYENLELLDDGYFIS